MNTFGVDLQPTVTVIALREEGEAGSQTVSVGDGVRPIVPNAVTPDGAWGSWAERRSAFFAAREGDGAWMEEPGARLFWAGLYARLRSYLGRLAPLRKNGYRLVIALQGANFRTEAHEVAALARAAGFDDIAVIPATHALLCRWLASPLAERERARTVLAIVVGEASTLVSGFQLEWTRGLPVMYAASAPCSVEGAGQSAWNRRVLDLLRTRLKEEPPAAHSRALQDAAVRYAVRLSQAEPHEPVEWHEIFEDRLYAPLALTHEEITAWPESIAFANHLPETMRDALRTIGSRSADLIAVGGLGAVWPFAGQIAAQMGRVWNSGATGDDVAAGATWWGELCEHPSGMLLEAMPGLEVPAAPLPIDLREAEPAPSTAPPVLPPWLRGNSDVF
jgi:hypothetical protein